MGLATSAGISAARDEKNVMIIDSTQPIYIGTTFNYLNCSGLRLGINALENDVLVNRICGLFFMATV